MITLPVSTGIGSTVASRLFLSAGRVERAAREHQRRRARHVRRGHRRAAQILVGRVGVGRQDVDARRREVDRRRAVVGIAGEHVGVPGRRDGNDVRRGVAGRIARDRRRYCWCCCRRTPQTACCLALALLISSSSAMRVAGAPAVVQHPDVRARRGRGLNDELDRVDRVGDRPRAVGGQRFHRHHAGGPVHPRHADVVVADGADRAGDVRAVAVVVLGIAGVRRAR